MGIDMEFEYDDGNTWGKQPAPNATLHTEVMSSQKWEAHTKKLEWLKVSSCSVTPSSRKMLPSTSTAKPSASPVMDADMPSPTYLELHNGKACAGTAQVVPA